MPVETVGSDARNSHHKSTTAATAVKRYGVCCQHFTFPFPLECPGRAFSFIAWVASSSPKRLQNAKMYYDLNVPYTLVQADLQPTLAFLSEREQSWIPIMYLPRANISLPSSRLFYNCSQPFNKWEGPSGDPQSYSIITSVRGAIQSENPSSLYSPSFRHWSKSPPLAALSRI